MRTSARAVAVACVALVLAGCGKKGPPLPPLRLVPAPVENLAARRTASAVELRFTLPTRNQNGPGPIELDRVEIYAITVPPGAAAPANRDLLSKERLVGSVRVKPAPEEDEPAPPPDPNDDRPEPGARAVFVEELTADALTPVTLSPAPGEAKAQGSAAGAPATAPQAGAPAAAKPAAGAGQPPAPDYPTRIYALRGVTRGGRPGPPAPRVVVPLVAPPPPPGAVDVAFDERVFMITWVPPATERAGALAYNVYAGATERVALNASPISAAAYEHGPVTFGEERCFAVRTVQTVQNVPIESAPSEPACAVPADVFPPGAPRGLQIVAAPEGISLSWNPNTEPDLGGYVVLRAEAPGETLQPLTREPITETSYRDTAVQPGVRYVYAIVAVDKATPPNTSAQSERQEVTAR